MPWSNITNLSVEYILIVCIFVGAFAYAWIRGKAKLTSLLLAFYPAVILFSYFPYKQIDIFIGDSKKVFFANLGLFVLFFLICHFIFNRVVQSFYPDSKQGKFLQIILLSLALVAQALVLIYLILPPFVPHASLDVVINTLGQFGFWWLCAPIVAILLASKQ